MSITNPSSVFIVGAGASSDFGLPLGGPLLSEVRDELLFQVNEMEEDLFRQPKRDGLIWARLNQKRERTGYATSDYPIWMWLKDNNEKEEDEHHIHNGNAKYFRRIASKLISVAELLDEQTSETIDDFIAMNPDTADIVKLAIACVFYRIIFDIRGNVATLRSLGARHLEVRSYNLKKSISRRNWVHLLINIVRHAVYNRGLDNGQKIRIINFNYDGILESILDTQFGNTGHPFKPWNEYIEIVHPHGWMGDVPETCLDMKAAVEQWASAINVVNELKPNDDVIVARETAAKWIREASEIYMAGFALSVPNAKMLDLGSAKCTQDQEWHIHNYNGSPGLVYSAKVYGRVGSPVSTWPGAIKVSFEGGSNETPMTIANWFQIGIPGEMPG